VTNLWWNSLTFSFPWWLKGLCWSRIKYIVKRIAFCQKWNWSISMYSLVVKANLSEFKIVDSKFFIFFSHFYFLVFYFLFWKLRVRVRVMLWLHCHKMSHHMIWCYISVTGHMTLSQVIVTQSYIILEEYRRF